MGKNTRRQWADAEAPKRPEKNASLKRRRSKKSGASSQSSGALVQMLHDSFPRRHKLHEFAAAETGEEQFADFSDIIATDWQQRIPDSEDESLYESRKLIMRQMVMNQLNYMREQQQQQFDDEFEQEQKPSDADSWLEIEQSFAEIYQPLPCNVGMDSWRSMSKEEMLQTITSRRLRAELKYLSRAEILSQIQTIRARQTKKKSPVYEDMSATVAVEQQQQQKPAKKKKEKKVKMVSPEHEKQKGFDNHTYQNTAAYRGQSLADIYQAKVEARKRELRMQKEAEQRARAMYVTKAQIHAQEAQDDDVSNASSDRQGFISRASILSKWGTSTTTPVETTKTKKELIEQFWRQNDYISTESSRSLNGQAKNDGVYKNPGAFSSDNDSCSSNCEECCDDDCSQCSCSSCASVGTILPATSEKQPQTVEPVKVELKTIETIKAEVKPVEVKKVEEIETVEVNEDDKAPQPVPLSLVKQRKMEFERLRVLEEQENRLKELVRQQKKAPNPPQSQSWLDIAKKARQLEDKWHKARRTASSVVNPAQAIYEPVPASQVLQKEDAKKKSSKSRKSRNRKRTKVLQQLRSRMRENLAADLDPGVRERRHQELQELLSDALHAGTQTLSNINLGLIYVPMEEQLEKEAQEKPDDVMSKSSKSSRVTLVEPVPQEAQNGEENEDVFGSIDTLIFEPKAAGGSSTLKTEEIDEMEKKIAHEFEYLNDSQYGSCPEDSLARSRTLSSSSGTSSSNSSYSSGSKNGLWAAAASVTAMPPRQQFRSDTEDRTGSCAAAACCDASAFNSSSTLSSSISLTSFESVIRHGEKSIKESCHIPTPPPLPDAPLVPPESSDELPTPRHIEIKSVRSNQHDSEAYTNVDTDASWDYYPELGNDGLTIGNLRKRPTAQYESEADATARLLESLRVAEETNASTSIRLIFPLDKQSVKDSFTVLAEGLPSSASSRSVQSPDSGFRSLPEPLPEALPETVRAESSSGPRKRDTMIRELKSRLMDKFQCVGDGHDSSAPPSLRRHPEEPRKKTKVASKLESLLSTFNALAEMKAEGRVYRVPREPLINEMDYDSIAFQSTGFPQHLHIYQRLQHPDGYSEPTSTIYNPSLPDEFIPIYNQQLDPACYEGNQFIDFDSRYPFDELAPDALPHEYSDPHDERSSSEEDERARKHRRRRKKRSRPEPTWSDTENQIFAGDNEEAALLLDGSPLNCYHPSRIAQYHDDWMFWDQMQNWCQSEADIERWESERTRRMLLWMHHVQQSCETSGLPMPACWQAKQRASVQWLLSKAYSHQVPDDLREPFYRDAQDQDYLKPSIVHSLANADLYCRALAYIYADPNYCQLNHWGVIQVLSRKGVYVAEPSDVALTETTLIHTSPLRMSAHMAVMEGLMGLFVKEAVSAERVVNAIRRFADLEPGQSSPKEPEQALLLWISKACQALKRRLAAEADGDGESVPNFPELRELADLSDGLSLMGLVVFYCPDYVDWTRLATNEPFSMADCLFNLEMLQKFCSETLPYNVFHLGLEDVVYMHGSVRQNMLAFLADLFYVLEVRPAKCVRPPSLLRDRYPISEESSSAASTGSIVSNESVASPRKTFHRRTSLQPVVRSIPDLRSSGGKSVIRRQGSLQDRKRQTVHEAITSSPSSSTVTSSPRRRFEPEPETRSPAGDESFVVQRGKTVPTLFNVADGATPRGSRVAAIKERFNTDTKAEERGEERSFNTSGPAGVPSNWEERKNTSYAGRRSRRNSITDESHLTIENFGGSQDNLSMFGRNPDKEPVTLQHTGRRPSMDSAASPDYPVAGTPSTLAGSNFWRRTNNERTRSQENLSDYVLDNRDIEEQLDRRSRTSSPTFSSVSSATKSGSNKQFVIIQSHAPPSGPSEAADLYEETRATLSRATNFAELSKLRETFGNNSAINIVYMQNDKDTSSKSGSPAGRRSADPRKASSSITEATSWDPQAPSIDIGSDDVSSAADLYGIRLKMEEKRKRIEAEKRQVELMANRQREKVGKAAFLQAVKGGKGSPLESGSPTMDSYTPTSLDSPSRPVPAQMVSTPEYERPEYDYHHATQSQQQPPQHMSPAHHPMQYDPYRPMNGAVDPSGGQFYLHEPAPSPRRMWGQPQPISPAGSAHMAGYRPDEYGMQQQQQQQRRAQWGAPQPVQAMMGHHGYMMPQNNYMDPRGPGGYMSGPPRPHPVDGPYGQGYYPNGAPFPEPADPYYYSPARQHPMQPMYPGYPEQSQRSGYSTPPSQPPTQQQQQSYPSSADQRAPFRLHPNDGTSDAGTRPVEPSFQRISEPPASRSPAPSVKSNHSEEQRPTPNRPEPKTTPSTNRPVPATRTMTPQKTNSSNGVNNSVSSPTTIHSAVPVPSIDDMEPQNVSFIETPTADEPDFEKLPRRLRNLNITSGSRTYRIPHESQSSPPRPTISKSFRASPSPTRTPASPPPQRRRSPSPSPSPIESPDETLVDDGVKTEKLKENVEPDRGFIITFDDVSGPKRPKPQLGAKRQPSPKKTSVSTPAPVVEPTISSTSASSYGSSKLNSREESPRRSLSSMAREYSPFESRDSGFGNHDEMKLFQAATATPGSLSSGGERLRRETNDSQDEEVSAMIIGDETDQDPETLEEKERKRERFLLTLMKRKQEQEEARQRKEMEALQRKEKERAKEEEKQRKKEEEKARRAIIYEQYKIKKAREEAEKEGRPFEMPDNMAMSNKPAAGPKLRAKPGTATTTRPRPKTIHVESGSPASVAIDYGTRTMSSKGKRGSNTNLTDNRVESSRGSNPTLSRRGSNSSLHGETQTPSRYRTMERGGHSGRKDLSVPRYAGQTGGSVRSSREDLYGSRGYRGSNSSLNDADSYEPYHTPLVHSGRKGSGFMTGARQESTLMTATAASASRAAANRANSVMSLRRSGSLMDFSGGPGSLPPGLVSNKQRRGFDDGSSDISSNQDYMGPKLYKQPAARSNRSIILNAVEYCVFPGVVNRGAKQQVLEEIMKSESKNFLVLFRDSACQFRALYSYNPEQDEIIKLYGNGPKIVNDSMFEKFFKYNSGGKCFSQVHTKHLTVTIDAFTIHAGLWQGKKPSLPNKKDMTLVI